MMIPFPSKLPDAILFDLDNTLVTFVDAKQAACNAVVQYAGTGSGEELFRYFLRPVHNFEDPGHIYDYLVDIGAYSPNTANTAAGIYDEVKMRHISLYPGVISTLDALAGFGVKMAVVTDASFFHAERRMMRCGIEKYFPVTITPDISGRRKPDHASFIMALERLRCRSSNVWIVGDSLRREIGPGNELGFTTIFAKYGDWIQEEFPSITPSYVIDRFEDLLNLIGDESGGLNQNCPCTGMNHAGR